ncbi:hypothetical protein SAMN04488553_2172 [Gramella sp. MAR_2010_147]|nr:hypothetical protein SAMN04488553_2172 [Gramella sp. MAR_2010_147]
MIYGNIPKFWNIDILRVLSVNSSETNFYFIQRGGLISFLSLQKFSLTLKVLV